MKKISLVSSEKDIASVNIKNEIINLTSFKNEIENEKYKIYEINEKLKLYVFKNEELIYLENLDEIIDSEIIIFLSKHLSISKIPGFYVHAIGNFHDNKLGGKAREICYTSAFLMKELFLTLLANSKGTRVGLEVTHHGPYVSKSACIFVEIGSTINEWKDDRLGKIVAESILEALKKENLKYIPVAAYGGPHYAPAFLKIQENSEFAIGHIMPDYAIEKGNLDPKLIEQPVLKTIEKVKIALIDWKGIKGEYRKKLIEILENMGLEHERV